MVPTSTIIGMVVSMLIAVLFPILLLIYYRRNHRISWQAIGIGALVWFVFTQVLEKAMHAGVLLSTDLQSYPVWFAIYGGLAAGLFEEFGRYIAFRFWLKKRRDYLDGISYGIGHGGFEAVFIGVIGGITNFVYMALYNAGTLESTLRGKVPEETINQLTHNLTDANFFLSLVGGLERVPAVFFHIALSLLVLYGIRRGQIRFLGLAILLHAALDFCAALFAQAYGYLALTEVIVWLAGIAAVVFLFKAKSLFDRLPENGTSTSAPL
ncbi:MAG TPA: YhfC family intramembrane metalloprotease [Bacilli bacterium]|nr:YhfC family intramembrane metalloprotease [Bacilli bacterium]